MKNESVNKRTLDLTHSARFVQSFSIALPAERIDLGKWVTEMTDDDYVSYSKAHKMMSSFEKDGIFYMKNLENIGTESLIQRYELKHRTPGHVHFYSANTTAYLARWVPARVGVPWEMYLTRTSDTACDLTCLIGVDFPNIFLRAAAWLSGLGGFFLSRHLREEGRNFVKDIERKFGSNNG